MKANQNEKSNETIFLSMKESVAYLEKFKSDLHLNNLNIDYSESSIIIDDSITGIPYLITANHIKNDNFYIDKLYLMKRFNDIIIIIK